MSKRAKSNSIRIIAGKWRGRRLSVVHSAGLRPTTDRVRETVFNWLMQDLMDTRCLDLFAGSGALGFESLSRGAKFVQFVDSNPKAIITLQSSFEVLRVKVEIDATLVAENALELLVQTPTEVFDLVFLDPPFQTNLLERSAALLEHNGWLSPTAIVYVERDSRMPNPPLPSNWRQYKAGCAGQSRYSLYRREGVL